MIAPPATLVVPRRFRGPAGSGNGGWTAGAAAALLLGDPPPCGPPGPGSGGGAGSGADGAPEARSGTAVVRVRLAAPPPLEAPMTVTVTPGEGPRLVAVQDGGPSGGTVLQATVLEATVLGPEAAPVLHTVDRVPVEAADEAGERYAGLRAHPFPECFACGPAREPGDGLRLRPGPVGDGVVAAAWIPDPSLDAGDGCVGVPVVWAALDCPGGWSVDIAGRPMVLGTMTAQVARRPAVGEQCVVTGTALREEARKAFTATTLYGQDGAVLARAAHVWIAVDPSSFGRPGAPTDGR